jgi:lambda family phage portal protein
LNIFDKVVAAVAPAAAVKRETARRQLEILREFSNSGYSHHGANTTKKSLIGWDSRSGSPKEDINRNQQLLIERSRDLYMGGASIATGAVKTLRTNVVGSGLVLKPKIDPAFLRMNEDAAEEWERKVAREFSYWAASPNCDRFRVNNFYELQQLAFISQLLSGDTFVLLPFIKRKGAAYDLTVHVIEADRVGTPYDKLGDRNISRGVEVRNGEVTAYYIFDEHPGDMYFNPAEYKRVEAFGNRTGRRNALHLMESERVNQTRGVPVLAPVMENLHQLGGYTKSELTAALVSSFYTIFVQTESPQSAIGEALSQNEQIDADDEHTYELGPGAINYMLPGEKMEQANPARPNVAFDSFVNSILRQVGSALELGYELTVKHFSASYSASRAALLEAWKMFRMRRTWLANDFCQPIYEEFLAEAVAKGRIDAPGFFDDPIIRAAYSQAEWHGPSPGQIDPLKEVKAAEKRIEIGVSTGEREAAELTGTDWNVNYRQLVKESRMKKEIDEILKPNDGGDGDNGEE